MQELANVETFLGTPASRCGTWDVKAFSGARLLQVSSWISPSVIELRVTEDAHWPSPNESQPCPQRDAGTSHRSSEQKPIRSARRSLVSAAPSMIVASFLHATWRSSHYYAAVEGERNGALDTCSTVVKAEDGLTAADGR